MWTSWAHLQICPFSSLLLLSGPATPPPPPLSSPVGNLYFRFIFLCWGDAINIIKLRAEMQGENIYFTLSLNSKAILKPLRLVHGESQCIDCAWYKIMVGVCVKLKHLHWHVWWQLTNNTITLFMFQAIFKRVCASPSNMFLAKIYWVHRVAINEDMIQRFFLFNLKLIKGDWLGYFDTAINCTESVLYYKYPVTELSAIFANCKQ